MLRRPVRSKLDAPSLVLWEVVGAPDARTLTAAEGLGLLEQVAAFGKPFPGLSLVGSDLFQRDDLFDLVSHARYLGLAPALGLAGTPRLTPERLERLRGSGAHTVALSLDGASARSHDAVQGSPGSFELTWQGCQVAFALGLRVQVNTRVATHNVEELGRILHRVTELGVTSWGLALGDPRGDRITPEQCEIVLHFLARAAERLGVRIDYPHHLQRVIKMRSACRAAGTLPDEALRVAGVRLGEHPLYRRLTQGLASVPRARAARSGRTPPAPGLICVDPRGDVSPGPGSPATAGNVRQRNLVELYRASPLFNPQSQPLKGRCQGCEFGDLCGAPRVGGLGGGPSDFPCGYEPGSFHLA